MIMSTGAMGGEAPLTTYVHVRYAVMLMICRCPNCLDFDECFVVALSCVLAHQIKTLRCLPWNIPGTRLTEKLAFMGVSVSKLFM